MDEFEMREANNKVGYTGVYSVVPSHRVKKWKQPSGSITALNNFCFHNWVMCTLFRCTR